MVKVMNLGIWRSILLLAALALPGCFDPIVGYPCAPGLTECGGLCVDLNTAGSHCGACYATCIGTCNVGVCTLPPDGSMPPPVDVPDAAEPTPDVPVASPDAADARRDAADAPGDLRGDVRGDADLFDGGNPIFDAGDDGDFDAPMSGDMGPGSPADAGGPGADAAGSADVPVAPADSSVPPGADAPVGDATPPVDVVPVVCMGGLSDCGNRCVAMATDPDNCGACGNPCGSGLCSLGVCLQQGVGHVVVIGHDYVVNRSGMNNLLGNAVFLSASDPVAVLVHEGHATSGAITGADFAINEVAAARNRHWQRTVGTSIDVVNNLQGYDVLLVYAQQGSVDQTLTDDGAAWAATMATFLARGKTVVLLDGPSGSNAGTFQILSTAGLLAATARTDVTGQTLTVADPGDAVSLRVPRTYRAEMSSVSFTTTELSKVVTTAGGAAVVIHRTF